MGISKSPRIEAALAARGIRTWKDVVLNLPYRYDDFHLTPEDHLPRDKERLVIYGKLIGAPTLSRFGRTSLVRFRLITAKGRLFRVEAWNRPYFMKSLSGGAFYTVAGIYDEGKGKLNLTGLAKGTLPPDQLIRPVYSLPAPVENHQYRGYVKKALGLLLPSEFPEEVPEPLRTKYRLLDKLDALRIIHEPKSLEEGRQGFRTLKYEECLLFSLKSLLIRAKNKLLVKNERQHIDEDKVERFIGSLPYKLTGDQDRALFEIIADMNARSLMYRLLQGDVGTGKTLVAALAFYANYLRGDQGAMMAPTDTLARQHFRTMRTLLEGTGMRIALLLGSMKTAERAAVRSALINDRVDLVVGTHVLFSRDISYLSLGLAVIDEQHKFGVNQRLLMASKGSRADLLLMSATPIPRTLALTLYGDLDISTLAQFPVARRRTETMIVKRRDHVILGAIEEALAARRQVFVVAPKILETTGKRFSAEALYKAYDRQFPRKVSLLHGRLDEEEQLQAIGDFLSGATPIIIATSLIEVGIDVQSAGLMVVYHPECFGLSSLHQLRGRIGRDGRPAKCLLVYDDNDEDELDKLNVLVSSDDGFKIAEEDLKRRGPGELGGYRQAGVAGFSFVNLVEDFKMFQYARNDAKDILHKEKDPAYAPFIRRARREIKETKFTDV